MLWDALFPVFLIVFGIPGIVWNAWIVEFARHTYGSGSRWQRSYSRVIPSWAATLGGAASVAFGLASLISLLLARDPALTEGGIVLLGLSMLSLLGGTLVLIVARARFGDSLLSFEEEPTPDRARVALPRTARFALLLYVLLCGTAIVLCVAAVA